MNYDAIFTFVIFGKHQIEIAIRVEISWYRIACKIREFSLCISGKASRSIIGIDRTNKIIAIVISSNQQIEIAVAIKIFYYRITNKIREFSLCILGKASRSIIGIDSTNKIIAIVISSNQQIEIAVTIKIFCYRVTNKFRKFILCILGKASRSIIGIDYRNRSEVIIRSINQQIEIAVTIKISICCHSYSFKNVSNLDR